MTIIWYLLVGLVLLFGSVILFGAPYLPTFRRQTEKALDLLDLKPGQTMLELGCGDGRVLRAAAERGIKSIGYELNPLLVVVAKVVCWKYRKLAQVRWGNYWSAGWPNADGVYVFLLDKYMTKLDTRLEKIKPIRLVSYAFKVPHKKIAKSNKGLFLYIYS
jgi:hypothetical protein